MFQTAFGASCMNRASVFECIWDSSKAGSLWGMMRGVGGVRKSEQSWLAKELGLLRWGFKGVLEEIPREEASTFQIGSVAFPTGQCTSPQLHPCHRLFDQNWHQWQFHSLPIVQTLLPVTFGYSLSSEAVVMMLFSHMLQQYTYICLIITRQCPWCNGYRRRNWTRQHEFKSWTDCISHSTNTLGKGMNPIILPPAMVK